MVMLSELVHCIAIRPVGAEGARGAGVTRGATQRAKFAKKVHNPPLIVNVINFELN